MIRYDHKEKDKNISNLNKYSFTKTLSMFKYENLPETIPQKELEKLLQMNGFCFITEHEGKLYAFNGGLGGKPDVYNRPTEITISNPALDLNKTFSIEDGGVLFLNDDMGMGLNPLYTKYNTMINENDINITLHGYNTRMSALISATDDKTRESAINYIDKIVDGEISVIGENALFDGVKLQNSSSNGANTITPLIELHQYLRGSLDNEIGLNSAYNMKKERLITSEVEQGEDSVFPLIYNMLINRVKAVDKINEMFDTNIAVDFGSVWGIKHNEMISDMETLHNETLEAEQPEQPETTDQAQNSIDRLEQLEREINGETETPEPTDESTDESTDEPTDEPTEGGDGVLTEDEEKKEEEK